MHLEKCGGCANRVENLAKQHYVAGLLQAETVDQAVDEAHLNTVISRLVRLGDPWATVTDAGKVGPGGSSWSLKPGARPNRSIPPRWTLVSQATSDRELHPNFKGWAYTA